MYLCDYHTHSHNSSDGKNSISEMCVRAISAGLKEIAVTDHFEPTLGNEKYPYYKPKDYFLDILMAKSIFGKEIQIKSGVELGQPHLYPEYSLKLIESNPYDFVLASVHKPKDNRDFGEIAYDMENVSVNCLMYLDELKSLAEWNKFDCLAHIDLVKRYAANYKIKVNLMDYRDKLEEILKIIIKNGKGIEVNTSGLRQAAGECMPGLNIIKLYKQLGGEIITVGSDAHYAKDIGKGIKEAIDLIKLSGFNFMTVFTNRKPSMVKISDKSSSVQFNRKPA